MKITYQMDPELIAAGVPHPRKANGTDSGFDMFAPSRIVLKPGERTTVKFGVAFRLELPLLLKPLALLGLGVEAHVRPKSGLSKRGVDVELGTVDEPYRGHVGATITNMTGKKFAFEAGEKVCQVVFVPVFNRVSLSHGRVGTGTSRGDRGFGSSGLKA